MMSRQGVFSDVDGRIHEIDVFPVQLFTQKLDCFAKSLEMDDFPFPKELDHIVYIRVITEPQDIVIGHTGLLLWHAQSFATK